MSTPSGRPPRAVHHVAHLNNAGAALPTAATVDAMVGHLRLESERGGYEAAVDGGRPPGRPASLGRPAARRHADEVVVAGSDTQAWTKALWGFPLGGGIEPGTAPGGRPDRLRQPLPGPAPGLRADRRHHRGGPQHGRRAPLDLDALADLLGSGRVALASLTHVGTHRGLINPVEEAGRLCRRAGVPYFLDACQSVGQLPVDVQRHRLRRGHHHRAQMAAGPAGNRAALRPVRLRRSAPAPGYRRQRGGVGGRRPLPVPRPGAERFLDFEVPVAGHLGLGVAIDHALALGLDAIAERVTGLGEHLRQGLASVAGVAVHDGGARRCGIVTFTSARPRRSRSAAGRRPPASTCR